ADASQTSVVAWEVKVLGLGDLPIRVRSSTGLTKVRTLSLSQENVPVDKNAGKFDLEFAGDIAPDKEFRIIARVTNPAPDQKLKLDVPRQLKLVEGPATQSVPSTKGVHQVVWRVRIIERGTIPVRVESTTGIAKRKTIKITDGEGQSGSGNIFGK